MIFIYFPNFISIEYLTLINSRVNSINISMANSIYRYEYTSEYIYLYINALLNSILTTLYIYT